MLGALSSNFACLVSLASTTDYHMVVLPPFTFSLLNVPLLAGMTVFIVARRPRQLLTWAFAGVMMGLAIFFLADVAQYQPGISSYGVSVWRFVLNQGSLLAIYAALALIFLLRDKHLEPWEIAIVGLIVLRMMVDTTWLAGHFLPRTPHDCLGPFGFDRSPCLYDEPRAIATGVIAELALAVLFISTTFKAAEPKRAILRRYLVWIVLLIVGSSVIWQALVLTDRAKPGVLPIAPAMTIAFILVLRLFLALEEAETGVRIPAMGWRVFLWIALLLLAVLIDLMWGIPNAPVWTLLILAAGVAVGGARLVNAWTRRPTPATSNEAAPGLLPQPGTLAASPSASTNGFNAAPFLSATAPDAPLRIYLFGPMKVVRNGETLPNTSQVWRSAKTRSLLILLALRRDAGVTQIEIIDALWPPGHDFDVDSERNSLSALRSYLSTLRRVLDPEGPRGSDRFVVHEGERYFLRPDEIWVDVWQFDALADQGETLLAQERHTEGIQCWQQAAALYSQEGLVPDETYLPAMFVEPIREHLRRRWLSGQRHLAVAADDDSSALKWWEAIHEAEPLDQEATTWLMAYHRRLGNLNSLRVILQRRREAEAEIDLL